MGVVSVKVEIEGLAVLALCVFDGAHVLALILLRRHLKSASLCLWAVWCLGGHWRGRWEHAGCS